MADPTPSVTLVKMDYSHLEATFRWLSDERLRRQLDSLNTPTRKGNQAYWLQRWADQSREDYAILDESGRHVGNCGLHHIDHIRRKAELWAYLGESRSRGLGSAAVEALLERAFRRLHLNRVYLRVLEDNTGAERFWRSLGFQAEGRWREDTCHEGRFLDSLWFSMLALEYRARDSGQLS